MSSNLDEDRSGRIEQMLQEVLKNQSAHSLAISELQGSTNTILGRGCSVGQARIEAVRKEVADVDEKHDKRALATIGSLVLALLTVLGGLYAMKIGK